MSYRILVFPAARYVMNLILRNWLAITIGHTIIAARALNDAELQHELVHVQQWDRYGLTFPFRYLLASIDAWRSGGDWHDDNAFEIEADA